MLKMPAEKVNNVTRAALLIDASGSMNGREKAVIDQLNSVITGLKTAAKEKDQKVFVSIYSFSNEMTALTENTPVEKLPVFGYDDYRTGGGTGMNNAVHEVIGKFTKQMAKEYPDAANLITVITDGEETRHNITNADLNRLITKSVDTDKWTFSFLMPAGKKANLLRALVSVADGNVTEWEVSTRGLQLAAQTLSSSYASYLDTRSNGATHSRGFFTATVDKNQAKEAKKKLDDVRSAFKAMTVRTQDPKMLQSFIESRKLPFVKGKSFYQLTKTELVQNHKEVLLREIKTGAVYGGKDARAIVGLPNADIKVKPSDFADWDIFVQSTSNNRKLQVGTNLLYLKK